MPPVPLSVLDLVPVSSGCDAPTALRNTVELARAAEEFGYRRYWLAEHHLHPGVAGSAPALVIQAVAQATREIRVGSGAVLLGHQTPLSVVEQFGILDALHPGRIDLGLGRSGRPRSTGSGGSGGPKGLARLLQSPRFQLQLKLLQQPGAQTPAYDEQIGDILALFGGTYRGDDGTEVHAIPGDGADVDVWILGSSAGESAEVAGARGLPFGANHHVSPGTVREAAQAYRAAFRPSAELSEPYVLVSADAVVGPDDETARRLAAGYAPWVRSIRRAEGAIEFPTPEEADRLEWTEEDRELVADRVDTQFVGGPETVTDGLAALQQATGADELLITTITHDHADRVRSYELLAQAWQKQA